MIVRKFKLALNAGKSIPLVIHANQYDHDEQWEFTLYNDDGTQYIPSSGAIVGIKSDNLGIINSGTVSGGVVIINETEQMTAAPGKAVFELMIDSQTHGTANFVVLVEPKPGDNASLSESDLSLLQEAIDSTSPAAIAEGVSDWMDENLTPTTPVVDASLTVAGAAADAKATGDAISDLNSAIQQGGGFNAEVKAALETLLTNVVYKGNDPTGRTYLTALHNAMYPPTNLSSISAVYTQSGTVYDTDTLDDLKSDLVVTAHYSDSTTAVVTNYVLSGTLTAGTSTITVTYGGKTTTFTVTVTSEYPANYTWLYKASDGQTLTQRSDLVTKTITNGTIYEELVDGMLHITAPVGNNGCKWDFVQSTQSSAVLKIKFKLIDCPASDNIGGFQPQVSNGTGGAKFGTARYGSTGNVGGVINSQTFVGSAVQWEGELTTDTWHILELDLANGKQTVTLDGAVLASNETTANQYCVNNRIFVQNNTGNGNIYPTEVYIDWISYWNRSA